ncbi:hypothetical protein ACVIIZ_003422 [Bradyrhizobium sp. USDA 4523]
MITNRLREEPANMTPLPRGATDEGAQNVGMTLPPEYVCGLADGTAHQFGQWPNPKVPKFGAGVYTIWHSDGAFVYVGMSGRGISEATVPRNTPPRHLHTITQPRLRSKERRPVLRLRSRPLCLADANSGRHRRDYVRSTPDGHVRAALYPREPALSLSHRAGWKNRTGYRSRNQGRNVGTRTTNSKPLNMRLIVQFDGEHSPI